MDQQLIFPTTLAANSRQKRLAFVVALLVLAPFIVVTLIGEVELPQIDSYIPVMDTVILVNGSITATLLFAQFSITRSPSLLALAGGFLFTAMFIVPHALAFPGAFASDGLFGGLQTPAWINEFWHLVFPSTVIAYALLKRADGVKPIPRNARSVAIAATVTTVFLLFCALLWLSTGGAKFLPAMMADRLHNQTHFDAFPPAVVSLVAMALLWSRRISTLDLWLLIVLEAWMLDALMIYEMTRRFTVIWYNGRTVGIFTSSGILLLLLSETAILNARLARERERQLEELQTTLAHVSRINELGRGISTLVHEVNGPLSAVSNYLTAGVNLAEQAKAEGLKEILQRAGEQVIRAIGIVRRLRDFVRRRDPEKQFNEVSAILESAVQLALAVSGAETPAVAIHLAPAASAAFFDRVQIEQVVFNLVRNAVEAMADAARQSLVVATALAGDDEIEISVADTGPGLSPAIKTRLFEPFVTTKASGLGVGLSICRFIIETHGGRLWADDNPGGGTVFRFTLPREARL